MNKEEITLEQAEDIVDNMYQQRFKECKVDEENKVYIDNLNNITFNNLEKASILLLRTEISQKSEIERLNNIIKPKEVNYNYLKLLFEKKDKEEVIKAYVYKCEQLEKLYKSYEEKEIEVMKKDKETERLNKELEGKDILIKMKTERIQNLMNRLAKRQDKIDRLNKEKDDLDDCNRHLYNENESLNNIINELESLLENPYNVDCINQNNDFLRRIKELKEGK